MTTLLVRGLDDEEPGDIVGAFVGETPASPDEVTCEMDGGRVGRSEMSVLEMDAETEAVAEYVDCYPELVERELDL